MDHSSQSGRGTNEVEFCLGNSREIHFVIDELVLTSMSEQSKDARISSGTERNDLPLLTFRSG